jgi:hypothetical protein
MPSDDDASFAIGPLSCPVCGTPLLDVHVEGSVLVFSFNDRAGQRITIGKDLAPLFNALLEGKIRPILEREIRRALGQGDPDEG